MNFELKSNPQNSKDSIKNDELSKLAGLSKEEIIPKSIKQNEINSKMESHNINEKQNLVINYGNIKILKYDENGDSLLVIGPNYLSFFLVIILNLFLIIFLSIVQYCYAGLIIRIFGLLLSFIQIVYLYILLFKKPRISKKGFSRSIFIE